MVSELNMTEQQAQVYKQDLEKVTQEFIKLKKQYMVVKKKHHLATLSSGDSCGIDQRCSSPVKFTGGGFKMSITSSRNS